MKITKKFIKDTFLIILLAILLALSYEIFILSNQFAPSGINGLATMLQYKLNFSVGYMSLIINVPLCIIAYFVCDKEYAIKTLVFVLVFSVALLIFKYSTIVDMFVYDEGYSNILAPIAAGVITGFTSACCIRLNSCTGGTDIIAKIYNKLKPNSNLVYVIFALNVSVAGLSYFVYDFMLEPVILCIIYCFMNTEVSDKILKGAKKALKFEIITPNPDDLAKEIIDTLHHSVTKIHATGMYKNTDTNMLVCIINTHQIADFENILKKYPETFAYISSVKETLGNFKKIKS